MILLFELQGFPLLVGVSDCRELSLAAPLTNFVFVPLRGLGRFKSFSREDVRELLHTEQQVKGLDSLVAVKDYVVKELNGLKAVFKGELLVEDYLRLFKRGG